MQKVNCAIYVRKSTEKGLDLEFNSLQNQEEACKNYILSQTFNGWEHFKTYTDGGISGGTMKRPALLEMIEDMKKGRIQSVLCYKVDRLSRSIGDFHNMMKEFEKYNCNFVSITQAFDTSTSMGKLTLSMLLSFAQFEREVSGERIRDKMIASKQKGMWTGGPPPLGYDVVNKKLIPNKKEAEQVKFIFENYLKLRSIRKLRELLKPTDIITKEWSTNKGKKAGGKTFSSAMIARILHLQLYLGRIEHKKGEASYPGNHKAIIDKKLFDEVQDLMKSNQSNRNETYDRNPNLLSGKIFDQNGNRFKNQKSSKNMVKKYRYYALRGQYLSAGDIDEITMELIKDFFNFDINSVLESSKALEFKSVNFSALSPQQQSQVIKSMVNKIIYHNNVMTYFIELDDLSYLKAYKLNSYLNTTENKMDCKIYLSSNNRQLILEKEILINTRPLSNKYIGQGKKIVTIAKNCSNLIKALSIGWRYGKMWMNGIGIRKIMELEQKADRTVYKYLNLNFLSPNIINDIMESNISNNISLQELFEIASKYYDFNAQEKAFYGI